MSKPSNPAIEHEEVVELLTYDASTGVFTWNVSRSPGAKKGGVAGKLTHRGYVVIGLCGRKVFAHRLAWFYVYRRWPEQDIDHINGVKSDNRIANLRDATRSVNSQNLRQTDRPSQPSGLLGVTWNRGRWTAQITPPGGRRTYLGRFDTPEQAHEAYIEAKRRLHPGCTI